MNLELQYTNSWFIV